MKINFRQPLSEQLNVRVSRNTLDMISGIAGKEGVSKTEVVRVFIKAGIKKWDKQYSEKMANKEPSGRVKGRLATEEEMEAVRKTRRNL